jgi:hypothetical protein
MFTEENFNQLHQRFELIAHGGQVNELHKVNKELIFFNHGINAAVEENNQQTAIMNDKIDKIIAETRILQTKVQGLKNKDAGSVQMYDDVRFVYNQELIGNWAIALAAMCGGYIFFRRA